MKLKHNKKRNTAFLYEVLIKELTKYLINKDERKKAFITETLRNSFAKPSALGQELELYKTLDETENVDLYTAERLVTETRTAHASLNKQTIYESQTSLIDLINKNVSSSAFSNFVPNYKNLATIAQIFNDSLSPKERVLLERNLISGMSSKKEHHEPKNMVHIDDLTYNKIIEGFNNKYSSDLLDEQRELLKNYIISFSDNGLSLKLYLNEEIGRLKERTSEVKQAEDIRNDLSMVSKADQILEKLQSFKKGIIIDQEMIEFVLKTQKLVSEVLSDGD